MKKAGSEQKLKTRSEKSVVGIINPGKGKLWGNTRQKEARQQLNFGGMAWEENATETSRKFRFSTDRLEGGRQEKRKP